MNVDRATLEQLLGWIDHEDLNAWFEHHAAEFERATGWQAPGKDSALGPSYELRAERWNEWLRERRVQLMAALRESLSPSSGERVAPSGSGDSVKGVSP